MLTASLGTSCWLEKERERLDMCGADDGEVSVIESGDALLAVAFGERDEPGVGAAQAQVGVLDHEAVDPLPIGDGERSVRSCSSRIDW